LSLDLRQNYLEKADWAKLWKAHLFRGCSSQGAAYDVLFMWGCS